VGGSQQLGFLDLKTLGFEPEYYGSGERVDCITAIPGQDYFAVGIRKRGICFWNYHEKALAGVIEVSNPLTCLTATPDGRLILAAWHGPLTSQAERKSPAYVGIWDIETGVAVRKEAFSGASYIDHICVSPDGRQVATAGSGGIFLWSLQTGEILQSWTGFRSV